MRSSLITDIVLQGGERLAVMLDTVDITNGGIATNKKDSSSRPIIHGRNVGENEVACDVFASTMNIERRVGRTVGTVE